MFDALVVGGGPAGSALAGRLASRKRSVLVLERSHYEGPRIGEHLTPDAQPVLESIGLWERFRAGAHRPCPGVRAAWGGEAWRELDYLFSPYETGWNLDRRQFDLMLAAGAIAAGAEVCMGARIASLGESESGWCAQIAGGERDGTAVTARFLVDATGRAAALARRLGSRRFVQDNLMALCAWLPGTSCPGHADRLLVEASEAGWWYAAQLATKLTVAVFLSDRDLIPSGTGDAMCTWTEALAHTRHIRASVEGYTRPVAFQLHAANSYILDHVAGRRWLAVGDAASAFDPLSSTGILKALRNGVAAAEVIARQFDDEALSAYIDEVESGFTHYLGQRQFFYTTERRWPHSLFWCRRHAACHR